MSVEVKKFNIPDCSVDKLATSAKDIIQLAQAKLACQKFETTNLSFNPWFPPDTPEKDYQSQLHPFGVIRFDNGVFWFLDEGTKIFMWGTQLPGTRQFYTPATLTEIAGVLRNYRFNVDQFLDKFPTDFRYVEQYLQTRGVQEQHNSIEYQKDDFEQKWVKKCSETYRALLPLRQQLDVVKKHPDITANIQNLNSILITDGQDVVEQILLILENGKVPVWENQDLDYQGRTYFVRRIQKLTSGFAVPLDNRFGNLYKGVIEEAIQSGRELAAAGHPANVVMQRIDQYIPEAKSLGIELSDFQSVAADSINGIVERLRKTVDFGIQHPAAQLSEEEKNYPATLYESILDRAAIAQFNEKEIELLRERIEPTMTKYQAFINQPRWKKLIRFLL